MSKKFDYLLFLINPFIQFLLSWRNLNVIRNKNLLWLFFAFYGLTFSIGKENSKSDVNRYVDEVKILHNDNDYSLSAMWNYYQNSGEIDVFRSVLNFSISVFTDDFNIVLFFYAIIFGFFLSRNLNYVFKHSKLNQAWVISILFLVLFLVIPIWNINGFRMWTAAHIFIYGILPYLFYGDKSRILVALMSPLVHFSFSLIVVVFLVYFFFKFSARIYFLIFISSLFFTNFSIEPIQELFTTYFSVDVVDRAGGYLNEDKIEMFRKGSADSSGVRWYALYYRKSLTWFLSLVFVIIYFRRKNISEFKVKYERYFSFLMWFFAFANLSATVPSGTRMLLLAQWIGIAFLIHIYIDLMKQEVAFRYRKFIIPALLLFILVEMRTGLYSTSITTVFGNPFIATLTTENNVSLNDIIK